MFISFLLFIFGISIIFFSNKNIQHKIINHTQVSILSRTNSNNISKAKNNSPNFNANYTKAANSKTVISNQLKNKNINAIGIMSIPNVNMKNPILNGYGPNGDYLALGACTMKPDQIMGQGNYALAGHYMDSNTVFHALHQVKMGDKVYLTNLKDIYVYQVNKILTINKYDVNVIDDTNTNEVTLITCVQLSETPYRLLVQGNLIKTIKANQKLLKKFNLNQ